MSEFPYAGRFPVSRILPEAGRSRDDVMAQLQIMASEEDAFWETGKCSGTIYCGDRGHYEFLNRGFGLFSHVNALQRDMCPSATTFEGEIIAMALDLFHAGSITGGTPAGLVTTGGTGSILHVVLAYREHARQQRGVDRPNVIKPETAHPAFDKACHLFGVELRRAPVDPATAEVDLNWVENHLDDQTIAVIGSACNYGYGTIDPIDELAQLARPRGAGLHVDACLGGFILPFGEELGYGIAPFDFRIPGVTSISADTHKYGYTLKGHFHRAVPRPGDTRRAVLLPHGLERRRILLSRHRGIPIRRAPGSHLGGNGPLGPQRLPAARPGDLQHGSSYAKRGPLPPGTAHHRPAHLPVQLHL
jgi:glutamate/tyrosine decarboxylase-like PLP-dependent enzyme